MKRLDESKRDVDWLIDENLDYKDKAAYELMQYKLAAARVRRPLKDPSKFALAEVELDKYQHRKAEINQKLLEMDRDR